MSYFLHVLHTILNSNEPGYFGREIAIHAEIPDQMAIACFTYLQFIGLIVYEYDPKTDSWLIAPHPRGEK